MEPILVYGYPSGTSMGLVAALEWLGQPYKLCRVDMLGEMREPAYTRINARVETPVLITDLGRPLTETMAIAAWLEARDTERRISFDPLSPEADRMHQFMAYLNTGFTGAFGPLWVALELPEPDPDFETALRRLGRGQVIERHDKLEAMLDGGHWLVGDKHSLADGLLAGVARWLEYHEVADLSRWPKLQALRQRVEADTAVVYATAFENGETPAGSGACKGHLQLAEVIERFGA
ncbi:MULTISPECIES: glutathione S-transferase family protein [unclassified Bosea (in: a-proteobacteria)]|uniref:glutathione S-transferase family protein n=1 Tax=unclassified Bosea (in: a-proteobacteria) TaxID=2653178 RepID=UPI000F75408B|nr:MULTISPECIES: glutathione S-transferase family protein [unclassified Bosea (in: a-proteobacteria)]AZO78189.1 glutathione S-transferase [Bosea sp. Tri-49]RXT20326.1 glutathione S-transferase [Bosea sp. Tri-39]RXT37198.1 glutathione S-transferase [Bosea sp. Tri-54]